MRVSIGLVFPDQRIKDAVQAVLKDLLGVNGTSMEAGSKSFLSQLTVTTRAILISACPQLETAIGESAISLTFGVEDPAAIAGHAMVILAKHNVDCVDTAVSDFVFISMPDFSNLIFIFGPPVATSEERQLELAEAAQ